MTTNATTNPDVLAAIAAGDVNPATGLSGDWADFQRMERDDRWLGFGYLGARHSFIAGLVESGLTLKQGADWLAEVDEAVHNAAAAEGLTYDQLFTWANARVGRWFGDVMFGAGPLAELDKLFAEADRFNLVPSAALVRSIEASA